MPIKHIIIFNVFKFTELRKGIKILINQNCFGLSAIQPGLEKKIKLSTLFQILMFPTSQILIKTLECKLKYQL